MSFICDKCGTNDCDNCKEKVDERKYPTIWAYEQACKALHFYEDISKIFVTAMNIAYEQAEHEKYDVSKQLKEIRETLSNAINTVFDMKVEYSKKTEG